MFLNTEYFRASWNVLGLGFLFNFGVFSETESLFKILRFCSFLTFWTTTLQQNKNSFYSWTVIYLHSAVSISTTSYDIDPHNSIPLIGLLLPTEPNKTVFKMVSNSDSLLKSSVLSTTRCRLISFNAFCIRHSSFILSSNANKKKFYRVQKYSLSKRILFTER